MRAAASSTSKSPTVFPFSIVIIPSTPAMPRRMAPATMSRMLAWVINVKILRRVNRAPENVQAATLSASSPRRPRNHHVT